MVEVVLVNFACYYYYKNNYFGNMSWGDLGWIRYGALCDLCLKLKSLFYGENQCYYIIVLFPFILPLPLVTGAHNIMVKYFICINLVFGESFVRIQT